MTELTKQQKIDLVKQMIEHKRDMDVFREKFGDLFGVLPGFEGNGDCNYQVFDRLFNDYISLVAQRIGETQDGINWFVWENDCGKNGMGAYSDDDQLIPICDAEDYVDFVELLG